MEMHRDSVAYINISNIKDNIRKIYKQAGKPIMAVVKADAYGHGLHDIARYIEDMDFIEMFGVATLEEALELRHIGIKKPILVLGVTKKEDIALATENQIRMTIYSIKFLYALIDTTSNCNSIVHIKIDTGMNRIGLKSKQEFLEALRVLNKHPNIKIEGVFTHYGAADENNNSYQEQLELFKNIIGNFNFKYIHAANSAATLYHQETLTNLVRCGIAIYGIEPNGSSETSLKQAMSLYSKVSMVKKIEKGERVGYGFCYEAKQDVYIATVPLGYGDGFIRKNQGRKVYINGQYYPIVGRICMDQMMIEVDETVTEDAVVEIFGDHISLNAMAQELDTIAYEIICLISRRIPRIYIK